MSEQCDKQWAMTMTSPLALIERIYYIHSIIITARWHLCKLLHSFFVIVSIKKSFSFKLHSALDYFLMRRIRFDLWMHFTRNPNARDGKKIYSAKAKLINDSKKWTEWRRKILFTRSWLTREVSGPYATWIGFKEKIKKNTFLFPLKLLSICSHLVKYLIYTKYEIEIISNNEKKGQGTRHNRGENYIC